MERKIASGALKAADKGLVTARFATLGVKDSDGDIIQPGAIGEQEVRVSSFGHASWNGALPVGAGRTFERGDEALAELKFFMDTTAGRDHFETIKGLGNLAEYSFGFDVTEGAEPSPEQRAAGVRRVLKRLAVHEVSPVLKGAGVNTGTVAVKCSECAAKDGATAAAEARKVRSRTAPRPGVLPADPDAHKLARFVAGLAHQLHRHMTPRRFPPKVRFFRDGDRSGFARKGGAELEALYLVNLDADLSGEELAETALHEARHLFQPRSMKTAAAEKDANAFARKWTGAALAAYRATEGSLYRVSFKDYGPPYAGRPDGDVVIDRRARRVYRKRLRNVGNAWSEVRE